VGAAWIWPAVFGITKQIALQRHLGILGGMTAHAVIGGDGGVRVVGGAFAGGVRCGNVDFLFELDSESIETSELVFDVLADFPQVARLDRQRTATADGSVYELHILDRRRHGVLPGRDWNDAAAGRDGQLGKFRGGAVQVDVEGMPDGGGGDEALGSQSETNAGGVKPETGGWRGERRGGEGGREPSPRFGREAVPVRIDARDIGGIQQGKQREQFAVALPCLPDGVEATGLKFLFEGGHDGASANSHSLTHASCCFPSIQ
jgi:hypothetical protein